MWRPFIKSTKMKKNPNVQQLVPTLRKGNVPAAFPRQNERPIIQSTLRKEMICEKNKDKLERRVTRRRTVEDEIDQVMEIL